MCFFLFSLVFVMKFTACLGYSYVTAYWNYGWYKYCRGPVSSDGIATGYGLDCPGIETRWGRDFSHTSRPALGPTQPPVL
jgi:hypothetical protein